MSKVDEVVKARLERAELKYRTTESGDFVVPVGLENDRSQLVYIPSTVHKFHDHAFRQIEFPS